MTTSTDNPTAARRRVRRSLILVAGAGTAMAVALAAYLWSRPTPVEPPTVTAVPDPEVAAAIEQARETVRSEPRSGLAWGRLGMVLSAHAYLAEAATCYAQAERLEPAEPRWPYFHALAVRPDDPAAAVPLLRRAADLWGDRDDTARLQLADLLLTLGRLDEAEAELTRVVRRDPGQPQANLGLGQLALERGDLTGSLAHLRRAGASPTARKAALTLQAEVHRRRGDATAVEAVLGESAGLPPDRRPPDPFADEIAALKTGRGNHMARVSTLLAQRRYAEAETVLELMAHDDPAAETPLVHLGRVRLDRGDAAAAEQALRAALRRAPESVHAHFLLGAALFRRDRFEEAATHFRRAAELKPADALAHYNLGQCLRRLGDRARAAEAQRAAVRCKPDLVEAHLELADVLADTGHDPEAGSALRNALAVNPDHPGVRRRLGRLASSAAGSLLRAALARPGA
jgi:tetratricopeptide (TPR) repeat protein